MPKKFPLKRVAELLSSQHKGQQLGRVGVVWRTAQLLARGADADELRKTNEGRFDYSDVKIILENYARKIDVEPAKLLRALGAS